jgi:hypothetical protein
VIRARARAQVGQKLGLHGVEREIPVLVPDFARREAVQEEDYARDRVDAQGGVGLGFLVTDQPLDGQDGTWFAKTHSQPLPLRKTNLPMHRLILPTWIVPHRRPILVFNVIAYIRPTFRRTLRADLHKRALQLVLPFAKVAQVTAVVRKISVA